MPTPFYHLVMSDSLLGDSALDRKSQNFLAAHRPAFMFGNTAPDVHTISGHERHSTHFFTIPIHNSVPAQKVMLARYSNLKYSDHLPADQVAFLAGYMAHLLLDQLWIQQVFQPYFATNVKRKDIQRQLFLHNVLRVYLERRHLHHLDADMGNVLSEAQPRNWLPFVDDSHLCQWRDSLVNQLQPGANMLTVEVFAQRMNRSTQDFEAILGSQQAMDTDLLSLVSEVTLHKFQAHALEQSIDMLYSYLFHTR